MYYTHVGNLEYCVIYIYTARKNKKNIIKYNKTKKIITT